MTRIHRQHGEENPLDSRQTYRPPTPFLPIYGALALALGIIVGYILLERGVFVCSGTRLTPDPRWLLLPAGMTAPWIWRQRNHRGALIMLVVALFALLGAWRYLDHAFRPCFGPKELVQYHAENPYSRPRVMEGVITGYPVLRETHAQYIVRIDTLWDGEQALPISGQALVQTTDPSFAYGDRVKVRGVPTTPPTFTDFDYRRYLARKGIYTLIRRADLYLLAKDQGNPFLRLLYRARAHASDLLNRFMPTPYAALANGMILGIESGIPRELYEKFNLTGTSHVIVISGSNIALVSGVLLLLFTHLFRGRKQLAAGLTLAGIAIYVALVGADAAVVRAGIMGGLYVMAIAFNRQSAAIISLFIAGLLMLLINPLTLWDVGFQLSFMATLGLILFSTPLQTHWNQWIGGRLPHLVNNVLAEGVLITIAAQITTMPLVVYYFGRLSLISFVANLLIIPVQPPIMIAGGVAILAALFFFPLGQLIALIPLGSLWWTVFIVEKMAAIPWGSVEVGLFGRSVATFYYAVFLIGFLWWLFRREQGAISFIPPIYRPALAYGVIMAGLFVAIMWIGARTVSAYPDGKLHLRVLGMQDDVAWHVTTPDGNHILLVNNIPEGWSFRELLRDLPGGEKPLDLLILETTSQNTSDLSAYKILPANAHTIPGTHIRLGEDIMLTLLATHRQETRLYLLSYDQFTLLLPLQNSQEAQARWLADGILPEIALLITPWPGTGAWPHPELITALQPQIILQPLGTTYPPSVQARLNAHPNLIHIPNNAITEIISDGEHIELQWQTYAQAPFNF